MIDGPEIAVFIKKRAMFKTQSGIRASIQSFTFEYRPWTKSVSGR